MSHDMLKTTINNFPKSWQKRLCHTVTGKTSMRWACALFMLLCSHAGPSAAVDPGFYLFPLEQASFEIDPTSKNEQIFHFDIGRRCVTGRCPVEFDIKFSSRRGLSENDPARSRHIRENFFVGETGMGGYAQFPLHVRVKLVNDKSEIVFDESRLPGEMKSYYYGGSSIKPLFGGPGGRCLPSGKYTATVQIVDAERDLSEFELRFVVTNDFKSICRDKHRENREQLRKASQMY